MKRSIVGTIGLIAMMLAVLSANAWATGPYTADANTVALFHLDETSGTTAFDSSANGYNGVLGGTNSWTSPGVFGGCLQAGGTGHVYGGFTAVVGTSPEPARDTGNGLIVEGWFKLTSAPPDADYLLGGTGGVYGSMFGSRVLGNGSVWAGVNTLAGWVSNSTAAGAMAVGSWTHIAFVSRNNSTSFYLNDNLAFTLDNASVSMANLIVAEVPWATTWSPNAFQGLVDEVRVESTVPEPGSLLALGTALIGLCGFIRRKSL